MYSNWSNDSCDKKINSGTVTSPLCCSSTKKDEIMLSINELIRIVYVDQHANLKISWDFY